jgi:hypothetical protein
MCSHVLQNIHELRELKQLFPELPVLFICTSASPQELTESEQHQLQETVCLQEESCCMSQCQRREDIDKSLLQLAQQLARIGKDMYEGHFLSKNRFVIHTEFITHSSFFFFYKSPLH